MKRKGFTLLELLVTLSVTGFLLVGSFTMLQGLVVTQQLLQQEFEMLQTDMRVAYLLGVDILDGYVANDKDRINCIYIGKHTYEVISDVIYRDSREIGVGYRSINKTTTSCGKSIVQFTKQDGETQIFFCAQEDVCENEDMLQ